MKIIKKTRFPIPKAKKCAKKTQITCVKSVRKACIIRKKDYLIQYRSRLRRRPHLSAAWRWKKEKPVPLGTGFPIVVAVSYPTRAASAFALPFNFARDWLRSWRTLSLVYPIASAISSSSYSLSKPIPNLRHTISCSRTESPSRSLRTRYSVSSCSHSHHYGRFCRRRFQPCLGAGTEGRLH